MKIIYFFVFITIIVNTNTSLAGSNYSLFIKTDITEYWVDHESIEILNNDRVRMKTYLNDFDRDYENSFWSLNNYDCKNELISWDSTAIFSKFNIKGKPYQYFKDGEMIETSFKFPKDSPEYKLMKYACVGSL